MNDQIMIGYFPVSQSIFPINHTEWELVKKVQPLLSVPAEIQAKQI